MEWSRALEPGDRELRTTFEEATVAWEDVACIHSGPPVSWGPQVLGPEGPALHPCPSTSRVRPRACYFPSQASVSSLVMGVTRAPIS